MLTMNETLFGGLIVAVLIFFSGRRLGLSSYWSAILAGLLPFLAYLGYGVTHPQAGDVLAIHLVVYMATAAVLGVFSVTWQKKGKMHWAPKALVIFFILLVIFNATLMSIATHGLPAWVTDRILPQQSADKVHTVFPGVIPHDRNNLYEPHQKQVEQQRNLGWQVDIVGLDNLHADTARTVTVTVKDAQGQPVPAERADLGFWRMANSKDDRMMQLKQTAPGQFTSEVLLGDAGRWVVEIHIEHGQDTYHTKMPLMVDEAAK
jgi:nitrogen fixation protein FixH